MTRPWRSLILMPLLVSGLAFAQPPQGDARAECARLQAEANAQASPEARRAGTLRVLEVARRSGVPELLQAALSDLEVWASGPDERLALERQIVALGLAPGANETMRYVALWHLVGLRWTEAAVYPGDPDGMVRVFDQVKAEVPQILPNPYLGDRRIQIVFTYVSRGRWREACTLAEAIVAGQPDAEAWSEVVRCRLELGDVWGCLSALPAWAAAARKTWGPVGTWVAGTAAVEASRLKGVPRVVRALRLEQECAPLLQDLAVIAERGLAWQEPGRQHEVRQCASSCHVALAVARAEAGSPSAAEGELREALSQAEAAGWPLGSVDANEAWAEMLVSQSDLQAAETKLDAATQAREKVTDEERKLSPQPLSLYAQVKYARGKLAEAIKLEEQALKDAEAAKDLAGQAEALAALAALYHESGKSEDGLRAGEKAAELTKQLGLKEADAATRSRLATLYYDLGDRDEAEAIEKGLRPLRRSTTSDWAAALRRSAQGKYRAGDFAGAIRLLKQAQKMDEMLGRKLAVVDDLNGLAACLLASAREKATKATR